MEAITAFVGFWLNFPHKSATICIELKMRMMEYLILWIRILQHSKSKIRVFLNTHIQKNGVLVKKTTYQTS